MADQKVVQLVALKADHWALKMVGKLDDLKVVWKVDQLALLMAVSMVALSVDMMVVQKVECLVYVMVDR